MHELISESFQRWINGPLASYRFTDPALYRSVVRDGLYQASLNAYLKSEADIQVKFGGFLESELLSGRQDLTVHAELNPYEGHSNWWADLSVHDVSDGPLWTKEKPNPIVETVKAVVEIKYSNYREPNWLFTKGFVMRDLEKLACLQAGVARLLILMDESGDIEGSHIENTLSFSRDKGISILSNNNELLYIAS